MLQYLRVHFLHFAYFLVYVLEDLRYAAWAADAKAMQKLAETLQDAKQKTEAGDMKQLAGAMKKLQAAAKEQSDIGKDKANKGDPNEVSARQEKVGDQARLSTNWTTNSPVAMPRPPAPLAQTIMASAKPIRM